MHEFINSFRFERLLPHRLSVGGCGERDLPRLSPNQRRQTLNKQTYYFQMRSISETDIHSIHFRSVTLALAAWLASAVLSDFLNLN